MSSKRGWVNRDWEQITHDQFVLKSYSGGFPGTPLAGELVYSSSEGTLCYYGGITPDWYKSLSMASEISSEGQIPIGLSPGVNKYGFSVSDDLKYYGSVLTISGRIDLNDGGNSVFIGTDAGYNDDVSSNKNVFIGYNAGYSNTAGNNNTANGYRSLYSNTLGNTNVANGAYSLYANITGVSNTANGYQSLYSNTLGNDNIANGAFSLFSNTTGSYNTATGYAAMYSNENGEGNSVNGFKALYLNLTGSGNIAFGYQSLYSNVTGDGNVGLGYEALKNNTSGYENVAVGSSAGEGITTGYRNALIGKNAGYNITEAYENVCIGNSSASALTIGDLNVIIGSEAGLNNVEGSDNVIIGNYCGAVYDTVPPPLPLTELDNCVYIGSSIIGSNSSPTNEIAIGFNVTGNGDNTATIGNSSVVHLYANENGSASIHAGSIGLSNYASIVVDTIEDTLTDDSTHIPTSHAVYTAMGTATSITDTYVAVGTGTGISGSSAFTFDSGVLNVDGRIDLNNGGGTVAIGYNAGILDDGTDNFNTFFGSYAGHKVTTGSNNTQLGYSANGQNATGNNNVVIGYYALHNSKTSNNTAVGYKAGELCVPGGTSNANPTNSVYIGYHTNGSNYWGADNEIVIGANAVSNGSNTFTAGDDNITDFYANENGTAHVHAGTITLGTGASVDTIETTLTDDDTHIPTSGAVYDAITGGASLWTRVSTTLSPATANDNVDIGNGNYYGLNAYLSDDNSSISPFLYIQDSLAGTYGTMRFESARPSSSALSKDDGIGYFTFYGWDGSAYGLTADIKVSAFENLTATDHGGIIQFGVTPANTTSIRTMMQVTGEDFIFNPDGAAVDLTYSGDTDATLFCISGTNDKVGISTNAPESGFHVNNSMSWAGDEITSSGTELSSDATMIFVNVGSSGYVNLPDYASSDGRFYMLFNEDGSNTFEVRRQNTDLINGGSTAVTVATNGMALVYATPSGTGIGWFVSTIAKT